MADELKTDTQNTADTQTTENEIEVKITQDKLNRLISEKYAKGAEKAKSELLESLGVDSIDSLKAVITKAKEVEESQKSESQKIAESLELREKELEALKAELSNTKLKAEITSIANRFGFVDEEFLEFEYKKVKNGDGFEVDNWINGLKETKPYLFKGDQKPTVKTDMSANKAQTQTISERIKMAKSQKELDAIYKELQIK